MSAPNSLRRARTMTLALALALALEYAALPAARADDALPAAAEQARYKLNGFGTVGMARSSDASADYVFDNLQPRGAGRSHEWSSDVDSRLGVQLTANFTSKLSGVVQVLSEYRSDGTYRPIFNWANLKYAFTPDFSVRVGRIGLASFLASDSRRVGFSNITARPPVEVYRLLALKDSDGIDAVYRSHYGDLTNSVTVLYGKKTVTNTRGVDVHSTGVAGVFDTLETGFLTVHAAYQVRDVDNQNPPLGRFMSIGASYDPGDWFTSAEYVKVINFNATGIKATRAAWYINGGYRLGNFSPYVTVSDLKPLTSTGQAPIAERTYATGVRWDFTRNMDLKLQFDRIHLGENSFGLLQNMAPGAKPGGKVLITSVVMDFIF